MKINSRKYYNTMETILFVLFFINNMIGLYGIRFNNLDALKNSAMANLPIFLAIYIFSIDHWTQYQKIYK